MPERSSISQGVQIGVESTYGTGVTCAKQLQALGIELTPDLTFTSFKPMGYKANTIAALQTEMAAANLTGYPTYSELQYPLSSLLGAATITTPGGGTLSRTWTWTPSATAAIAPVSFTVQTGDGSFNEKSTGLVVNSINLNLARDGVDMSGDGFAKAVTFTAGVMDTLSGTQPTLIPILPSQISVYMDPPPATYTLANIDAAFGVTKLTRVVAANLTISDRYNQLWALDAAQASYVAVVEKEPTWQLELVLQADAVGMGLLATARAGTQKILRVEGVTTAFIEGAIPYKYTMDCVGRIVDGGGKSDTNDVQTVSFTFDITYDSTWLKHLRVALTNAATAL